MYTPGRNVSLLIGTIALVWLLCPACTPTPAPDTSIRFGSPFGNVHNGTADDAGTIDLPAGVITVAVPAGATITRGGERIRVVAQKVLGFVGHPPSAMSIASARTCMGVATRVDDDGVLLVGTYGEWDSHIEGGAYIELALQIPVGVEVIQRDDLGGEASIAAGPARFQVPGSSDYWYAAVDAAPGWTRADLTPQPARPR
ncbi:MAG: hypothetical protein AB7K09_15990 [Planctomycetota bacterium]